MSCFTLGATTVAEADDWGSHGWSGSRTRLTGEMSGASFGAGQWKHVAMPDEPRAYQGLLASPAVGDGYLVYGTQRNQVRALRAADGALLWQTDAPGAVFATPAVWRGRAIVMTVDKRIVGYHLADGQMLWSRGLGALGFAAPEVVEGSVFIATGHPAPRVFRLDAETGRPIWESGRGVIEQAALAGVAVADGHVVVSEVNGRHHAFALDDGALVWTAKTGGLTNRASPLIANGRVYLLTGGDTARVHALALATGQAIDGWPLDVSPAAPDSEGVQRTARSFVTSSLAMAGSQLVANVRVDDVLATPNGKAFRFREFVAAFDGNGTRVWTVENGTLSTDSPRERPTHGLAPTPALFRSGANGYHVAVTSSVHDRIRIFDLKDGRQLWSAPLSGPCRASPVLANGRLFAATDAGTIHSFASDRNAPPQAPSLGFSPQGGAPVDVTEGHVTLRWGAAIDPEGDDVTYEVRMDDDGEVLRDWDQGSQTRPRIQQWSITELTPGQLYTFAVRARDSKGAYSAWSRYETFRAVGTPRIAVRGRAVPSIMDAVSLARPGDHIQLGIGVFALSQTVKIPAAVSLVGAGAHRTVLSGTDLDIAVAPQSQARLEHLTVADARTGVDVTAATDVHLQNVILRDNDHAGLRLAPGASANLINATVVRNGTGVSSGGQARVKNTIVTNNSVGLAANPDGRIDSHFNDVVANKVMDYSDVVADPSDLSAEVAFDDDPERPWHLLVGQPTTDRGDPADSYQHEPQPNGGRINLGAFGNTEFAEVTVAAPGPTADTGLGTGEASEPMGRTNNPGADAPEAPRASGGCRVASVDGPAGGPSDGPSDLGLAVLFAFLVLGARRRHPPG